MDKIIQQLSQLSQQMSQQLSEISQTSQISYNLKIYKNNIVVLFGIGNSTDELIDLMKYHEINIQYICNIDKNLGVGVQKFKNIPVISPLDLKNFVNFIKIKEPNKNLVIQISDLNMIPNIEAQLTSIGINTIISINNGIRILNGIKNININTERFNNSKPIFETYKNKYSKKRCFIIGNGPSLKINDLERLELNDEITFGSNRIHLIFKDTTWRPTFYCAQDLKYISNYHDEICDIEVNKKFMFLVKHSFYEDIPNALYSESIDEDFFPNKPNFSKDSSIGVYNGFTITYSMIQLAIYMGFTEIYLLGVDSEYSKMSTPSGIVEVNNISDHFSKEYDNLTRIDTPHLASPVYKTILAYEKAREFANKNNIKIYNATRGGKLEVFDRINFDDIF